MGLATWISTFQVDLAIATGEYSVCQQQGITLNPQYAISPYGDQPAIQWLVDYAGHLSQKCQYLVLTEINTYS